MDEVFCLALPAPAQLFDLVVHIISAVAVGAGADDVLEHRLVLRGESLSAEKVKGETSILPFKISDAELFHFPRNVFPIQLIF